MANWLQNNTIITNLGLTMLAKAQAGLGKMHITKVVTASLEYDESVYKNLSEWVNKLRTLEGDSLNLHLSGETSIIPVNPESSITPKGDDYDSDSANPNNAHVTQITARFSNESVTEAYKIHQVIVFMRLIDLLDAKEDLGEIPYMVAQSDGNSDYDYMPLFSDNPTAINYDLYVVHSGVANIELSVKTSGFVKEEDYIEDISEIHNIINNIQTNSVGQHTEGMTFNVWSPVYTADDDPSGARQWSKSTETVERAGNRSAERFNNYSDTDGNMAIGANSHIEGTNNVALSVTNHIEGDSNHSGEVTYGSHIEGRRNSAKIGWFQHVEGELNQSAGYLTHMEGAKNKADIEENVENVGMLHIEGMFNTVENGVLHHVEGEHNTVKQGRGHHVEGTEHTVDGGANASVSGRKNTVASSGEVNVSGMGNLVVESNQAAVSGINNTVVSSERAIVAGINNKVTNSRGSNVSGDTNTVQEDCFESSVSGYTNSMTRTPHTFLSGIQNTVVDSSDSIISGRLNNCMEGIESSLIVGNSNKVRNDSLDSSGKHVVSGRSNEVIDSNEIIMSGHENKAIKSARSVFTGRYNETYIDAGITKSFGAEDSFIGGESNNITRMIRSMVMSHSSTITDYQPNGVTGERIATMNNFISGESLTINGLYSSVVTGKSNIVKNVHDSIIGGKENEIYSEVPDTGTSCVLCVGFGCTVNSKGSPVFAVGTDNVTNAENVSVLGKGNFASGNDQTVMGRYNAEDLNNEFALIVGGGTSSTNRKNILTLDWTGKLHITGLYVSDIWNADGTSKLELWNIADGTGVGSVKINNTAANIATGLYSVAMGNMTQVSNNYSVAGGNNSVSGGQSSLAFGDFTKAFADYSVALGHLTTVSSVASLATGWDVTINSDCVAAFGCGYSNVVNTGAFSSFTSGYQNANYGATSFMAGGSDNVNRGTSAFVTGANNENSGNHAVVAGTNNTVSSRYAVFGDNNSLSAESVNITLVTGNKNVTGPTSTDGTATIDSTIISGTNNFVRDYSVNDFVSGNLNSLIKTEGNIVSGYSNSVSGISSDELAKYNYVNGNDNTIKSQQSIVSGRHNYVTGGWNIVNGYGNIVGSKSYPATSNAALANLVVGHENYSSGVNNILLGRGLRDYLCGENDTGWVGEAGVSITYDQRCIIGKYNETSETPIYRNVFTIAGGTSDSARLNLFAVASGSGGVYARGTYNTEGADIAEWFEWEDGNTLNHDRRGLFVTLSGDKIVLADENTKYILGIVSARPSVVGDSYEDNWNQKYLTDVFGEVLYEDYVVPAETQTVTDNNGEETVVVITPEHIEKRPILNPEYDPEKEYIPRSQRPEWSYVSCTGKLVMVDDGTCVPNGYCRPMSGGIATASDTGYRVMKRIDDTHILVWTEGAIHFE